MKKIYFAMLAIGVLLVVSPANAALVDFDDLPTPNTGSNVSNWGLVPTSYQGLTWTGWEVTQMASYQSVYNNTYTSPSAPNAAYNGGDGNPIVITSNSTPFNVQNAYFSAFSQNNNLQSWSATSLTINGYLGSTLVGSTGPFSLSSDSFLLQNINLYNIDRLEIVSSGAGQYWLMDNLQYSNVPIPGAVWLLGTGLVGLVALKRRQK